MADTIKTGSILISDVVLLPESLLPEVFSGTRISRNQTTPHWRQSKNNPAGFN
jgi:hypothetical protein